MGNEYMLIRKDDLNCQCHINPELEILYVNKGTATVWYEAEPIKISEGEATAVFPFSIHRFSVPKGTEATVYMFSTSVVGEADNPFNEYGLYENKFFVSEITKAYIEHIISRNKWSSSDIKAVFYAFASDAEYSDADSKSTNKNIRKIVEYIYKNLEEEITLSSVAREFFMSEKAISEIFRKNLKTSFPDFLSNIRIEKSKFLLIEGEKTVAEIAFECGFGSVRSFNRRFLTLTGKNPTSYKKSIKNVNI